MNRHLPPIALAASLSLLLGACAAGPVIESEDPLDAPGPGLFSGPSGEFTLLSTQKKEPAEPRQAGDNSKHRPVVGGAEPPEATDENRQEFEDFKAWLRAREQNSQEYREFQIWRAYQRYHRPKTRREGN